MKIKTGVTIFALLALGIYVALALLLVRTSDQLDQEARDLALAAESISAAKGLKTRLLIHNRNAFFKSVGEDTDQKMSQQAHVAEIMKNLERMSQLGGAKEGSEILEEVRKETFSYFDKQKNLRTLRISPENRYWETSHSVDATIEAVDRMIQYAEAQLSQTMDRVDKQNRRADQLALLFLVLGGILLSGVITTTLVLVMRPLRKLTSIIRSYEAGGTAHRAPAEGVFEIREIATHFNEMVERLEEKRKDQLRFIASIAHDLRNPLNSMSMASDLLASQSAAGDRELAMIFHRQVHYLDRLVGDLLDTSRIESGHLELEISKVDLGQLVKDAANLHKLHSELHSITTEIPEAPLLCRCDARRISQVLNNLISNAIKYSPNGGQVKVQLERDGAWIWVHVTDSGIGIEEVEKENIFQPFHRTRATKGTIPGIGLGLSASRRIIRAHGGDLKFESQPGQGTRFSFSLSKLNEIQSGETQAAQEYRPDRAAPMI